LAAVLAAAAGGAADGRMQVLRLEAEEAEGRGGERAGEIGLMKALL
jgi:hypothetical protein